MSFFKTRSTARKSVLAIIYAYIPMFLLAFLGLKVAVITWLYLEGMLLLVFAFCLFLVKSDYMSVMTFASIGPSFMVMFLPG